MAYICITPTAADGSPLDPLTYEVDSDEGRAAARRALAEARIEQATVYVGEPDGEGDSHTNGQVLLALECRAHLVIEGGTCNGEEDAFEKYVDAVAELLPANFRLSCVQAPFRSVGEHGEETDGVREVSEALWTAYCEERSTEDAVALACGAMLPEP
jgi:hypothetical protein